MSKMKSIVTDLLNESDVLLLGLLNNPLFGVYLIQREHFIFVNQRFADMLGYTQDELCTSKGPLDVAMPADQPIVQREIDRRLRGEISSSSYVFRAVRKNGYMFEIEVYGFVTQFAGQPAIIGILHDISERKNAERKVLDQLHFIEKLVETIPNPVFYKDEQGRYLGCNAAFEHYIGYDRHYLTGRTVYDISPKDLADIYFAADKTLLEHPGTQNYEASVTYADGSRHNVVFYKATFNKSDGNLGGLVGVILDISERKQMEETIWHDANYDALTGLPNRRLLQDRLNEELKRAHRNNHQLAVLFIDLDRFKEINDTLGHNEGDKLLIQAAQRIRTVLRISDTVARQGGDEFIVILPDISDTAMSELVAKRIISSLTMPYDLNGQQAHISASIGIACYPDDSSEMETLIRYADQAMYAAKSLGRSRFCLFASAMQAQTLRRLEISSALRQAILENQFEMYYQPILDIPTGHILKAEALIRWNHPHLGVIGPIEFIPIAEEIGLIGEINNWVFEQVISAISLWQAQQPQPIEEDATDHNALQISINISAKQFMTDTDSYWLDHLKQMGVSTQSLILEVPEDLLLDDRPDVIQRLLLFREGGVSLSIDNFGSSYSAMSYLKKFDVDYLKIDRSFISELAENPRDLTIIEAIISMAHKLGIQVMAQGVETAPQHDLLRQIECDYVQGFLFAKPMRLLDFLHFVVTPHA
ncbi:EAL domain-containing protein [Tolumonas lignilytica]|uniref:sensor domain-containing protein n=1 Tax=Tolumonas lignilytica TaxID=1283284 RepID=UPI00068762EA|nr:EAL domain-containing protein [Tolumonas lignilytica]